MVASDSADDPVLVILTVKRTDGPEVSPGVLATPFTASNLVICAVSPGLMVPGPAIGADVGEADGTAEGVADDVPLAFGAGLELPVLDTDGVLDPEGMV